MKRLILLSLTAFCLTSCWPFFSHTEDGKFLEEVVRLDEFNSEYDDYNSDLPSNRSESTHLLFSSKREKKNVFNLVSARADFSYHKRLEIKPHENVVGSYSSDPYSGVQFLASRANGNFNVLGPKSVLFPTDFNYHSEKNDLMLFYADDSDGNLDIKHLTYGGNPDPEKFDILNSDKDDAYPTFSYQGDKIYFCSNRGGNFDIYEVTIPRTSSEHVTRENVIHPKEYSIRKMDELSSPYEDKCPYLLENTMVFVSDRPGGKGGFDLYTSTLENGKWSAPVNAGDRINTLYNEYRPILPTINFTYKLMIFSSDRPGGKGGFDLYMTGLEKNF
ncbi:PD40 domain-containing protein [Dyadobacter sp. 3J3]|uniref:TolB family protein n=1 Tax=Dyadobacter sp. 3J3 TaxID=2606600 RepID=UPI00135BA977|nr:PD40 domain-containing protein [Dyadobacter sp. 3J3]